MEVNQDQENQDILFPEFPETHKNEDTILPPVFETEYDENFNIENNLDNNAQNDLENNVDYPDNNIENNAENNVENLNLENVDNLDNNIENNEENNFENLVNEDDSTDEEDVNNDYNEIKDVSDDTYPFQNAGSKDMNAKEKFDKDVVTPYLFSRLIGGSLGVEEAKRLGDLKSRRKLYRELTNLFRHLEN